MGSGINGLNWGGIRDHSRGIGISGVFHGIKDQAFKITMKITTRALTGIFESFIDILRFYGSFCTVVLGVCTQ